MIRRTRLSHAPLSPPCVLWEEIEELLEKHPIRHVRFLALFDIKLERGHGEPHAPLAEPFDHDEGCGRSCRSGLPEAVGCDVSPDWRVEY